MQSPLLGFNNNVKHRGRVFHIQTEDSGIKHPHVITHLFADGGRILKTTKTSYAELLNTDGLADRVRTMMKEQHQAMATALHKGEFDRSAFDDGASSRIPAKAAATPAPRAVTTRAPAVAEVAKVPPPPAPEGKRAASDRPAAAKIKARPSDPGAREAVREKPGKPPSRPAGPSVRAPSDPSREKKASSGRFVASRPAASFATNGASDASRSLFGEDVISEKSLDEVILGYLSEEDAEGTTGSQK